MAFELPRDGTPASKINTEDLFLTPPSSQKVAYSQAPASDRKPSQQAPPKTHEPRDEEARKQELRIKRLELENERLKNQINEKINTRLEDANERKRQRDEAQMHGRRNNHEAYVLLKDERAKNDSLQENIRRLDAERATLQRKVDTISSDHDDVIRKNRDLERMVRSAVEEQQHATQQVADITAQSADLRQQIQKLTEDNRLANVRVASLEQEASQNRSEFERSQTVQKSLVDELTEARMGGVKANELNVRLQKTLSILNEKTKDNLSLTEQITKVTADCAEQKKIIDALTDDVQAREAEVSSLAAEKMTKERDLTDERKEVKALQNEIAQLLQDCTEKDKIITEKERAVTESQAEVGLYQAEIESVRGEIDKRIGSADQLKRQKESLEERLATVQREFDTLRGSLESREAQVENFRDENRTQGGTIATLQSDVRHYREEIERLNARLDDRNQTIQEQREKLDDMNGEVADLRARRSVAAKTLDEEKLAKNNIEAQCIDLKHEVEYKAESLQKLEAKIQILTENLAKAEALVDVKEQERAEARRRLDFAEFQQGDKEAKIKSMQAQLDQTLGDLQSATSASSRLEAELREMKSMINDRQVTIDSLRTDLIDTQRSREVLQDSLANAEHKAVDLSAQLEQRQTAQDAEAYRRQVLQEKYEVDLSSLRKALELSEATCVTYREKAAELHESYEKLQIESARNAQRAQLFEKEILSLEGIGEQLQLQKEKHIKELEALQAANEELEQRQTDSARQLHRLMKDLRDANAETMDVIKWRDEERAAHDDLKREFTNLQKESTEEILELKNLVAENKTAAQNATHQLQNAMRECGALGRNLQQKEEELRENQIAMGNSREELMYLQNDHKALKNSHERAESEISEIRHLLNIARNEAAAHKEKNGDLAKKIHTNSENLASVEQQNSQLKESVLKLKEDIREAKSDHESLKDDYESLRSKYRALKENEQSARESISLKEQSIENLSNKLKAEQKQSNQQKLYYEHIVHKLQLKHEEDKQEASKLNQNVKTLRTEHIAESEKVRRLENQLNNSNAAVESKTAQLMAERDMYIKKYHSACFRNLQVERECHEAQKNYLNEYESFDRLKINNESHLQKVKERIIEREDKFREALVRERKRAEAAEEKLRSFNSR